MHFRLPTVLRRLRRACDGFVAFELIIVIPAFVLAIAVTFTAFDMYRLKARDAKATVSIADALSRETSNITASELATLAQLHTGLIQTRGRRAVRISVVDRRASGAFRLRWSKTSASSDLSIPQPTSEVLTAKVPPLAEGEVVILVQTAIEFTPFTGKGFSLTRFDSTAAMRPRNAPQLCWSDVSRASGNRQC